MKRRTSQQNDSARAIEVAAQVHAFNRPLPLLSELLQCKSRQPITLHVATPKGPEVVDNAFSTISPYFAVGMFVILSDESGKPPREYYSVTHIPTGMKVAGDIANDKAAYVIAAVLAALPAPWASSDPYSFLSIKPNLPAELKAWVGLICALDRAELDAA